MSAIFIYPVLFYTMGIKNIIKNERKAVLFDIFWKSDRYISC